MRSPDLVLQGFVLQPGGERLKLLLQGLPLLLGLFALVELDALLGDILEALSVELGQGLDAVFVHRLRQVDHLVALLQQPLDEGRRLSLQRRTGQSVTFIKAKPPSEVYRSKMNPTSFLLVPAMK